MYAMKTILAVGALFAVLAVQAAPDRAAGRPSAESGDRPAAKQRHGGRPGASAQPGSAKPTGRVIRLQSARDRLPGEDRRLLDAIEDAEDFKDLMRLYPRVRASRSAMVRSAFVEELDDYAPRSINLLVPFIADPDEDVADAAFLNWSDAVEDQPARRRPQLLMEAAAALSAQAAPPPVPVQPGVAPVPVQPVPVPVQPGVAPVPVQPVPVPVQPGVAPVPVQSVPVPVQPGVAPVPVAAPAVR